MEGKSDVRSQIIPSQVYTLADRPIRRNQTLLHVLSVDPIQPVKRHLYNFSCSASKDASGLPANMTICSTQETIASGLSRHANRQQPDAPSSLETPACGVGRPSAVRSTCNDAAGPVHAAHLGHVRYQGLVAACAYLQAVASKKRRRREAESRPEGFWCVVTAGASSAAPAPVLQREISKRTPLQQLVEKPCHWPLRNRAAVRYGNRFALRIVRHRRCNGAAAVKTRCT